MAYRAASALVLLGAVTLSLLTFVATADCVIGGFDLSSVPQAQLVISQQFGSNPLTPYTWVVNFCQPVNSPPDGASPCTDKATGNPVSGYITQYSTFNCAWTWNAVQSGQGSHDQLVIQLAQIAPEIHVGWTATVTLICGGSSNPALVPTGPVVVTGATPALTFFFEFATSAVCGSPAGTPTPMPPGPSPSPSSLPPVLPMFFQGKFTEYTAYADRVGPPYVNGVPPAPLVASRGAVYYDWTLRNMIEIRYDYCVNIFPEAGHDFPCVFQNVNGTSYLITYNRSRVLPACCVFAKPWYPPPPAFLRQNVTADFFSRTAWDAGFANWFKVPSIAPPTGPFFYSFNASVPADTEQVYTSFAFPGISGWVQQAFFDISATQPDSSVWTLPSDCLPTESLPSCDFFGSSSSAGGAM